MGNPFEDIIIRLDKLERMIKGLKIDHEPKPRIVKLEEFCKYTDQSKQSVYNKLSGGEAVPGSFKFNEGGIWYFDLNAWDAYVQDKRVLFNRTDH